MGNIVWLASYPKSGNTWLRAFLANLVADAGASVPLADLPQYCEDEARPELFTALAGRPSTELTFDEITVELAEAIAQLSPFGMGNPEPVFMVRGATIVDWRVIKDRHVKIRLAAGGRTMQGIGFNMAQRKTLTGAIDAVFSLELNEWNGRRDLQMRLKDFRDT